MIGIFTLLHRLGEQCSESVSGCTVRPSGSNHTNSTQMPSVRKIDLKGPLFGIGGLTLLALGFVLADALIKGVPGAASSSNAAHVRFAVAIVDNWQSLLGALFTPLVAALSVWMVLRQIQAADGQEDARVSRRWKAQRALMPVVMSRVCSYAERSGAATRDALVIANLESSAPGSSGTPPVEVDELTIDRIVTMIEVARFDDEAEAYAELLTSLQVLAARWSGFCGADGGQPERRAAPLLHDDLVDAAELYAMASNLLAVTRPARQVPGSPMSRQAALTNIGVRDFNAPSVKLAMARDEDAPLTWPATMAPPNDLSDQMGPVQQRPDSQLTDC